MFSLSTLVGCNLDEFQADSEKTEEVELEKLETPNVSIDEKGVASWKKIKNADAYVYIINSG